MSESSGLLPGLEDLPAPAAGDAEDESALGALRLARTDPVARVAIDTRVPHLDRLFDYLVPADLDEDARPGTRVRVVFHGRSTVAWLIERRAESEASVPLQPLREVVSPVPALAPEVWDLVRAVAARSAGLDADVLRLAVPTRAAALEKAFLKDHDPVPDPEPPRATADESAPENDETADPAWATYAGGPELLAALRRGKNPRGVVAVAPSAPADWAELTARACAATVASGRRALVLVADRSRLQELETALNRRFDADRIARLSNDAGQTERYRNFLAALYGTAWVVIGTRSAAFAPVPDLGLVACWDDGDSNFVERQAPYAHARDVLLLRASLQGTAALFLGHAVSPECQRLVGTGWAAPVAPDRASLRRCSSLVVTTSDSWERAKDPLAALARIPQKAYRAAREALAEGPVLIQVARTGYAPALACQRCRASARCTHCHGPLALEKDSRSLAVCRWCRQSAVDWACSECGNRTWRLTSVGALRTAEELGRAFPQVPVVASSGENIKDTVPDRPSIVVATPGAEPRTPGGYRAALLLDGDRLLARDSLRNSESVLRRWMNAAALVRSREDRGTVVCTAEDSAALQALVRWDPAGFAARELAERQVLGLPPAVRTAAITGPRAAVEAFMAAARLGELGEDPALRIIDPVPVEDAGDEEDPEYRAIVFMSYRLAPAVTERLRATRSAVSAARRHAPVQIRCDALDIL